MPVEEHQPRAATTSFPVRAVEAVPIALPARREWRWRGLGGALGRWVVVRVEDAGGLVGFGEATPLPDWGGDFGRSAGETPETVVHVVEALLAPVVAGRDPFDVEAALEAMDAAVKGHVYAKAAVEMALWDLQGKRCGQPVHRLLGGRYRTSVPVAHMIGIMGEADAVEEARAASEDGCRAFQVKGTGDLERDARVLAALRGAVGDGVLLRLDANQGYRGIGRKAALAAVRALAAAGADLVEQPTEGLAEMAALTAGAEVPIVADESCWSPRDALEVAERRAADALSVYVAKAGGLARARTVAALAQLHGLPCDVNGSLESGIGTAASLALAVAMPAITLPAVIPVSAPAHAAHPRACGRYYADDVIAAPLPFSAGALHALERPGLGVEVDEDKLERYRVDRP